jgi:hypothetical protein
MRSRPTLWSIVGVIVAVVIAWFLVDALLHLVWFVGKLIIVAVVAVLVYLALRGVLGRRGDDPAG